MYSLYFVSILSFFVQYECVLGYKIVIFVPTLSNSQMVFNYRVGDLLASAGHDVVMYRPQYNPAATKGTSNKTRSIKMTAVKDIVEYKKLFFKMHEFLFNTTDINMSLMSRWMEIMVDACEVQITDKTVMDQMRAEKFDLAIGHMYDYCPLGLIHALKIPSYIWMSSGTLFDHMVWDVGLLPTPSFVPTIMATYNDRMNLVQRTKNFLGSIAMLAVYEGYLIPPQNALFRKHFGADFPDVQRIAAKSPLLFINSNEFLDFPRPILHKIIYIGGIGISEAKPLKPYWQKLMDNSKGVILFSMGSVADSARMPDNMKKAFLDAFVKFPDYTFVWKYEEIEKFPEAKKVKNLVLSNWVPQRDMFAHPKFRAFITHGGYNSYLESCYGGVPIVAMPLFGDQPGNKARAERHGIGIGLDKMVISAEKVESAIHKVLEDPSYMINAKRMASMLKKKPFTGEELVTKWVDFLAEYKTLPNLEPSSIDLDLLAFFSVDVMLVVFLGIIIGLFIVRTILYLCYWRCCEVRFNKTKHD